MKRDRIFRTMTLVIILAWLAMVTPANPCFAQTGDEAISLSPSSGEIGDDIDINGRDFEEYDLVYFYFSSESASVGGEIDSDVSNYERVDVADVDGDGDVSGSFSIPDRLTDGEDDEAVEDGTYRIYATYADDEYIVARGTVTVGDVSSDGTGGENISVSPSSGTIDDNVDIDGTDFEEGRLVYFYFSGERASIGDEIDTGADSEIDSEVESYELVDSDTADSDGDVSGSFSVPDELNDGEDDEAVGGGTYYVYAVYAGDDEIVARDTFSVSTVRIYLSPKKGAVGTEVQITGTGFGSDRNITVEYDTTDITDDIVSGDTTTSSLGKFTSTINVPESASGDHTITVSVSSRSLATARFTVEPKITISPTSGSIGDSVEVTGTGFVSGKAVTITFDSDKVGTVETDFYGSFETTFSVPEAAPGSHDVKVEDGSNHTTVKFTITTSIDISPVTSQASPGHVGTVVTISGTGFKPNSVVTITYASEPVEVATVTSEADGSFEATFGVPPSKAGEHTITASDGTSSMKATFFMESTPPAAPAPLLPYTGDRAETLAYFDWEDVTDASEPVTYDLQIATDINFTNVLVKKTGLTASEYTLTEEEALEPTDKDAPYYWMVMAVDAASNTSKWTGVGGFTVGDSSSGLSGWVLYTVIAVGACLFLFIGFWVVRRILRRTVQERPLE